MGLPPALGSGALGLPQAVRQASMGLTPGQGAIGPAARQSSLGQPQTSLGLPQSQNSLGLASSGSLGASQRQGSIGLPQNIGQGKVGLPYEPSPQDLQVSSMHANAVDNALLHDTNVPCCGSFSQISSIDPQHHCMLGMQGLH